MKLLAAQRAPQRQKSNPTRGIDDVNKEDTVAVHRAMARLSWIRGCDDTSIHTDANVEARRGAVADRANQLGGISTVASRALKQNKRRSS